MSTATDRINKLLDHDNASPDQDTLLRFLEETPDNGPPELVSPRVLKALVRLAIANAVVTADLMMMALDVTASENFTPHRHGPGFATTVDPALGHDPSKELL